MTVVYPATHGAVDPPELPPGVTEVPVAVGRVQRAASAGAGWLAGRPGQVGWFAPRRLAARVRRLARSHDLVLFVTSRPVVAVAAPVAVDHVDCLSLNAARRATSYRSALVRALWREEARRLRRWERRVAREVAVQLVTSPADAASLPAHPLPVVVPNGVKLARTAEAASLDGRDIDVLLTGNMAYPPNRDAAGWLGQEIVPRLQAQAGRPLRVVVAGRTASGLPRWEGVDVASDVPDLAALLARAKVAVAPLRIGTGVPNKVLEAALADAALVLTPQANAALALPPSAAAVVSDTEGFAGEVLALLNSDELRSSRVRGMRAELRRFDLDRVTAAYEAGVILALRERRAAA
ncbi:MAG: glycosyltransferase family 4 protein [Actinomycetota bacterium]|nr:glycosyltransferase family 4 protein [Actinomycetota bacterium]